MAGELLDLYLLFFRMGAVTFGGGYAMLPILQREVVDRHKWVSEEELLDCYAIGQCTPGVIAVNTATFCGYRTKGLAGAVFSTLGVLFPPILIVLVISAFFWSFAENPWVAHALVGVRACVCALILNSTIQLFKKAIVDVPTFLLFTAVFILAAFVGITPSILVIGAGLFGLAWHALRKEGAK
jgi:chromate transporter